MRHRLLCLVLSNMISLTHLRRVRRAAFRYVQKRVSVKRSYGYNVTGVGHTSLSSASIWSGEIIIPS